MFLRYCTPMEVVFSNNICTSMIYYLESLDILINAQRGYYYPRKIIPRPGYENLDINKLVAGLYVHGDFATDIFYSCFIQLFD